MAKHEHPKGTNRNGAAPPRSPDGRDYPEHLRSYERLDGELVPIVRRMQPVTFDELSTAVPDTSARAALPRWLASAQWRGVVERGTPPEPGLRSYSLAARAGAPRTGAR
jgi:hypothetical protein